MLFIYTNFSVAKRLIAILQGSFAINGQNDDRVADFGPLVFSKITPILFIFFFLILLLPPLPHSETHGFLSTRVH